MDKLNLFNSDKFNKPQLIDVLRDFVISVNIAGFSDKVVLKGGLNLEVALKKYNKSLEPRPTVDADFHMKKSFDWELLLKEIPNSVSNSSPRGIRYFVLSRRGLEKTGTSDSIKVSTNVDIIFEVDMNLSDYDVPVEVYAHNYLNGYSVNTMLADKLKVFFSKKIYRRSKDLYDLFLLSYLKAYAISELRQDIINKWSNGDEVTPPLHLAELDKIKHAYESLRGIHNKPSFDVVFSRVSEFSLPLVTFLIEGSGDTYNWDVDKGVWRG